MTAMANPHPLEIAPTAVIKRHPRAIPEAPGVYVFLSPRGADIMRSLRFSAHQIEHRLKVGGLDALYLGSTLNLRARIHSHLGGYRSSNLVSTILAAELRFHIIAGSPAEDIGILSQRIREWLIAETWTGHAVTDEFREAERKWMRVGKTCFNITLGSARPGDCRHWCAQHFPHLRLS
ncbi:GIY-YIG nuclease family protein [Phenylobacterium soli]|uniref:hypothetical protein n=1 Tax=Phenylobacterium soli TaxID=2170551 RepID=UPI001057781B|nr:hypothetical protein [Phenylobacterium soli]